MSELLRERNGGDLLVALMDALGVDTAFGVVSVHNLPLIDAVARDRRFVPVRNEASAVSAADGYGRARGSIGVAITSTGTGAGNAAGALVESLAAGSSVLHITGQIELQYLGKGRGFIHETRDQIGMLQAVNKAAYTIYSGESATEILSGAAAEALSAPRGPVSVEWPIDLQYHAQTIPQFDIRPDKPVQPNADAIEKAARIIAEAKRPLVWAGGGSIRARAEVEELLNVTRAGLITSNSGRGVVNEGHGSCVGNYATNSECADLLSNADVLISIGTHFRSNETSDYKLKLPATHIQIDVEPAAVGRVYPASVGIVADAGLAVSALLEKLPARTETDDDWLSQVAHTRRAVRAEQRESIGWQATLCDAVRAAFPRAAVIARDVTIPSSTWGNRLLSVEHPTSNIFAKGGGIGQGLGMGIGASISRPDLPTLVMAGDGGLAVNFGELATLAQEKPWLLLMVFNDRGYGVLRNTQDSFFTHRSGVDLATPDFSHLARAFNLPYWNITDLANIEDALADALQTRGPAIVEIDVDALGPMPRPFIPPVVVGAG